MIVFFRNTHEAKGKGPVRPTTDAQQRVWQTYGFIGHALSHDRGMTLDEVLEAERQYYKDNPTSAEEDVVDERYTALALIRLADADFVRVEDAMRPMPAEKRGSKRGTKNMG